MSKSITKHRGRTKGLFSFGNSKLPTTTAIFNMTAAHDCPSYKLGYCQVPWGKTCHACYAKKSERRYKLVLAFRRRQAKYWNSICFSSNFVSDLLDTGQDITALRFNEAGDFPDQESLDIAEAIATVLRDYKIVTYGYTARKDLDFTGCENLVLLGSGFWKPGLSGEFRLIDKSDLIPEGFELCPMNCRICNRCMEGKSSVIYLH